MTKYFIRTVTATVRIFKGSDNRDSDNSGPTVLASAICITLAIRNAIKVIGTA